MTNEQVHTSDHEDSMADAVASIVLVLVFVAVSIYWVSGQ